jgi:hypothetical protein
MQSLKTLELLRCMLAHCCEQRLDLQRQHPVWRRHGWTHASLLLAATTNTTRTTRTMRKASVVVTTCSPLLVSDMTMCDDE